MISKNWRVWTHSYRIRLDVGKKIRMFLCSLLLSAKSSSAPWRRYAPIYLSLSRGVYLGTSFLFTLNPKVQDTKQIPKSSRNSCLRVNM